MNTCRLGDLVVSDEYGVVQYDSIKKIRRKIEVRAAPRPPASTLLHYTRHLIAGTMEGRFPWEAHIRRGLEDLGWARPPAESDFLGATTDHRQRLDHPDDPSRRPDQPRLFSGLIASSNILLKDPVKRDALRDYYKLSFPRDSNNQAARSSRRVTSS